MLITKDNIKQIVSENNWKQFDLSDISNIPNVSGIYIYINKINYKTYIGQSRNIHQRTKEHFKPNRLQEHIIFDKAIIKYGKLGFDFFIIEECSEEDLNMKEMYYIEKYESFTEGYNMTKGGEGGSRPISEFQKQIISEKNSKETWAYNFKTKEFISESSRTKLAKKLNELYHCNINSSNIQDTLVDNSSYSKDFIFENSKEKLVEKIKSFNFPKDKELIYLKNYKTEEIFGPITISEGENIIKQYNHISSGHLYTAIKNNSKYVKDFIFGKSLEELNFKMKNLEVKIYAYSLETRVIYTAWSSSELKQIFEDNNLKFPNTSSYRKCINKQQKQAGGYIFDYNIKNLIKRVYKYYSESIKDVQEEIFNLNLENDQDIINITDFINELSINI